MLWACWNESMALGMYRTKFYARAFLLKSYRAYQRYSFNFAGSRSEWPIVGFVSIAVTSMNIIAQLAVSGLQMQASTTQLLSR